MLWSSEVPERIPKSAARKVRWFHCTLQVQTGLLSNYLFIQISVVQNRVPMQAPGSPTSKLLYDMLFSIPWYSIDQNVWHLILVRSSSYEIQ